MFVPFINGILSLNVYLIIEETKCPNTGGQRYHYDFGDDPSEIFNQPEFSDFFHSFFGRSARNRRVGFTPDPGSDLAAELLLTLQEAFDGTKRIVEINSEKIRVSIKAGAYDGLQLRVKGKGEQSSTGRKAETCI